MSAVSHTFQQSNYRQAGELEQPKKKAKGSKLTPASNPPEPTPAAFARPMNGYSKEPRIFVYRNADGSVHSVAARWDFSDGSKKCCSYFWGEGEGRAAGWIEQHHPAPILYRLPEVMAGVREGKEIVFVEGEKDVHGAIERGFEERWGCVFTTTPNGAIHTANWQPWKNVDYTPLNGACAVLVPDPDPDGSMWGSGVAMRAGMAGARVRTATIPHEWTNGHGKAWGFGDRLPANATEEHLRGILTGAVRAREYSIVPHADDEMTPVMALLDKALLTDEPEPPMRSISGWPVEVELREPYGLHELTAAGSNDGDAGQSRLPPPKSYIIARHNPCSMELLIEHYAGFYLVKKQKDGGEIRLPKRLPGCFVTHYLEHKKSKLPKVSGLMTMPLVLLDGRLLASSGLDRELKTVFCIEPGIVQLLPQGAISESQIVEAMRFLTDGWLVDVPTDYAGKCTLIALALSVLERQLFGERPAFFITAGKRGCGKTTAATMIALALTGKRAAAAAWSPNEEERRKSVFAALLQGVSLIIWDNIQLGTAVSCATIEKVLTGAELEDRVLGESRNERVSCAAIQVFTGNNIAPKGDMASRSLNVRLTADRPDPENRRFKHPDPFEWTLAHRGEIVKALYTVLLGNPRFKQPAKRRPAAKTRFKQWWHLVGAPIEHAAGLVKGATGGGDATGMDIDFGKLFLDTEAGDEESATLAEVLDILGTGIGFDTAFKALDVLGWLDLGTEDAKNTLKDFFIPREARRDAKFKPSTRSIGRRLMDNIDAPVWIDENTTLTLHGEMDRHDKTMVFRVEHKVKAE